MQVNKKHTDGQSDSSSIGSFQDDTDREVCSLTDRAFKSLCVAELESSYTEADPVVSPIISHQFSSKFSQGPRNRAIKRNTLPNKALPKTEEHSTFQLFPNDTQEGQNATINVTPSIRMKLSLPVPSLRNYKHTSKVSSLIKTFDKAENMEASATAKQPVRNSLAKLPLICGGNMAFWGGKTILNLQKELSEFSEPFQDVANANGRPELPRRQNKMDLACHGPRGFYRLADASNIRMSNVSAISRKAAKNRTGKAKEPVRKGSFLHSENSAFESWNLHHKKLEAGGPAEIILKEGNLTYFEETPFFREARICESKQSPTKVTGPVISEQGFSGAFPQKPLSQASLTPSPLAQVPFPPQANTKDIVSQALPSQASDLPPPVHRIPTPPSLASETSFPPSSPVSVSLKASTPPQSLPQASVPPEAMAHVASALASVPQVTVLSEKTSNSEFNSELKNVCPPWRKQKKELGGTELTQEIAPEVLRMKDSSYRKAPGVTPMAKTSADESCNASSDPSSPSFNISKLLTPVLPPKQEREPSEGQSFLETPPISETETAKEMEERTFYSSQNNYKSKAPSLLFNLKDIRKRVKSTYSPSPLLRILDDKKIKEQDGIKASVAAANTLEGSNKKWGEADRTGHKPSEQIDSTNAANSFAHFIDSYLTPEDSEMSSLTDVHPNECHVRQYSPSNSIHLADVPTDPEAHVQSLHLQDLKSKQVAPSHSADAEPQVSPYLFFTPEENINDSGNQACPPTGSEHRGKRSTSSSEQSFVSIIDQPIHDDGSFSLMQLFQKACHQESQRRKNEWSTEEKLCSKEEEEEKSRGEKRLHDYSLSICRTDAKQEEQGKNDNAAREREMKEEREDKRKSMDSASEAKLEEPQTPTSPSSLKPNMFMIKDNTFKSPPVIKAVKLPLLRSLSCEEAITGSHAEAERQSFGPIHPAPNIQEMDLLLSRNRNQQGVSDATTGRDADESRSIPGSVSSQAAGESPLMAEYTLKEGPGGAYMQELVGEDEGDPIAPGLSQKSSEKQLARDKEKARARKLRRNSSSQPILSFESDPAQNRQKFPVREKANYFKNNLLSKRRGGSCVKKIISQEMRSPTISETYSHASSDVFRDTPASSGTLTISTIPSPRSSSAMQSAFTSPFSDTSAVSNVLQSEKTEDSSSLHGGTESGKRSSALETFDLMQTSQLSGDAGSSPVANERLQMAKTAAKPPAVPPKSEKALRRAKKLASKRKKTEAQQKTLQDDAPPHCGDTATLQPVQSSLSPTCLNSSLTPSESHLVRLQPAPSLSPTPSLPATTQRKLLQDPDSGEYFIVDLPVQFKTFYDPESGRYIQLSIPPSKRNLSQTPSSESVPSSYVLYPSTLPSRVSSVPVQASPSQFNESASLMQRAILESASDWSQGGRYPEPLGSQPYMEPAVCDVHSHETDGSQYNFEKDGSLPDNADIISMGALEDFAVEGVS